MTSIQTLTRLAHDWAIRCFGADHVTNLPMRSLRLLEESAELAQALHLSREQAHLCIDRVYDKPPGDPNQEVGGVMVTLNILCESMRVDSEAQFEQEVRRILKKSPDHFAKRNQAKINLGLDACAQSSGDPFKTICTRPAPHVCATTEPCNGLPRVEWRDGERVKADRLWRDPEARKRFESESSFLSQDGVAEYCPDYGERFTRWALIEVRNPRRPDGTPVGDGGPMER